MWIDVAGVLIGVINNNLRIAFISVGLGNMFGYIFILMMYY